MCLVLFIKHPGYLLIFFCCVLLLYRLSRLRIILALKNLRPFVWLFLITVLLHLFFTKGTAFVEVPLLHIQIAVAQDGLVRGLYYILRIATFVVIAALLTLTTSPMALTDAIESFLRPFRCIGVPAHEIAMMLSISLRFIPILIDEADRIQKAQMSRGSRFDGKLIQRIKNIFPIIIPLFLSTFRRANDLALAMDARCYRGGEGRSSLYELKYRWPDGVAVLIVLLIGIPIILIR